MKYFILTLSVFIFSCGDSSGPVNAPVMVEVPVVHRDLESEVYKTVAVLSIEGMMCAQGCGGKIMQELTAVAGVGPLELDFEDHRAVNKMRVEFDPAVTDEKKIFACIQAIADGKYKVVSAEILHYKGLRSDQHAGASV
jgi:mercuric ion binding protein